MARFCAHVTTYHRPLQLLVSRLAHRWLLSGNCHMKWSAHTLQLRLLAWTQEQDIEMLVPPEDPGKASADALNKRGIFWSSKAKGHMHSIRVLNAREIRSLEPRSVAEFGDQRVLEQALGLAILLADEANSTLAVDLCLALWLAPEH